MMNRPPVECYLYIPEVKFFLKHNHTKYKTNQNVKENYLALNLKINSSILTKNEKNDSNGELVMILLHY